LRKVIKTRGSFPSEESALKLLYLALNNVRKRWQPTRDWKPSLNHYTLLWGDHIEAACTDRYDNRAGSYAPKPGAPKPSLLSYFEQVDQPEAGSS